MRFLLVMIGVLSMMACKKTTFEGCQSGTTATVYRPQNSEEKICLNIFPNGDGTSTGKLYLENADPYRDMIGHLMREQHNNGIASSIEDLSGITLEQVTMNCAYIDTVKKYMTKCELVLDEGWSTPQTTLATFKSYEPDASYPSFIHMVFDVPKVDYTSVLKSFGGSRRIYFQFDFNGYPPKGLIAVNFDVGFTGNYSLTCYED